MVSRNSWWALAEPGSSGSTNTTAAPAAVTNHVNSVP